VDFMSTGEQAALRANQAARANLARFASSSDDEAAPRVAPPASRKRARSAGVPQVDGAANSSDSDDSSSEDSESEPGSEGQAAEGPAGGSGSASGGDTPDTSEQEATSSSSSGESDSGSASGSEGAGAGEPAPEARLLPGEAPRPSSPDEAGEEAPSQGAATQQPWRPPGIEAEWAARLLPAGGQFMRTDTLEQVEASWRIHRDAWAQDYRSKHRQAARQSGRAAKRGRRK
jgi:hypothetical protein